MTNFIRLVNPVNAVFLFHVPLSGQWFENTLRIIGKFYRFVSLQDIHDYYEGKKSFRGCCHICFDDGHKAVYYDAYPVLKALKVPASLYVSPKMIFEGKNYWFQEIRQLDETVVRSVTARLTGVEADEFATYDVGEIMKSLPVQVILNILEETKSKTGRQFPNYNISPEQLIEMDRSGVVTVGAHTLNHPILSNEEIEDAQMEITGSVSQLSQFLERQVTAFAYPNGLPGYDFCEREMTAARNAGIKTAFSCQATPFTANDNPLAIPRVEISRGGLGFIAAKTLSFPLLRKRLENQNNKNTRVSMRALFTKVRPETLLMTAISAVASDNPSSI